MIVKGLYYLYFSAFLYLRKPKILLMVDVVVKIGVKYFVH